MSDAGLNLLFFRSTRGRKDEEIQWFVVSRKRPHRRHIGLYQRLFRPVEQRILGLIVASAAATVGADCVSADDDTMTEALLDEKLRETSRRKDVAETWQRLKE